MKIKIKPTEKNNFTEEGLFEDLGDIQKEDFYRSCLIVDRQRYYSDCKKPALGVVSDMANYRYIVDQINFEKQGFLIIK